MVALAHKLVGAFRPLRSSTTPNPEPPLEESRSGELPFKHEAASKTASSCELFGMFRALAAGEGDPGDIAGDMDSDEDEGDLIPQDSKVASQITLLNQRSLEDDARTITNVTMIENEPKEEPEGDALQRWLDETMGRTIQQRDTLSSRFTALSLSNLSPFGKGLESSKAHSKRPALPRLTSKPIVAEPDPETDTDSDSRPLSTLSTPSTGVTTPDIPASVPFDPDNKGFPNPDEPTDEQKLAAIVEEFGDIANLMESNDGSTAESERILAESKGSLFKGIMMIGNLHLTTHRVLFHALLPPDAAFVHDPTHKPRASSSDEAMAATAHQPDVLHSGAITVHRPGPLKQTRRVWMELSAEMVTTYPSGDETGRVRPLRCILLSSVRRMEPLDPANPCDFYITYNSVNGLHTSFFTVDTEQSAIQWRRAFDSALFRHARMRWRHNEAAKLGVDPHSSEADLWNMMRCCIPLDRVTIKGISDYHGFSTLIGLEIELDGEVKVTWHPEQLARGDFSGSLDGDRPPRHGFTKTGSGASTPQRSFSLRNALPFVKGARATPESASPSRTPTSSSPTPGHRQSTVFLDSTLPPRLALLSQGKDDKAPPFYAPGDDWLHAFTFNIAVLNEQAWFAEALQAAVDATAERKYKQGAQRPRMIMEVAGYDCLATDEEVEAKGEVGSRSSTSSSDGEDDEGTLQSFAKETRKAEKAALASKVFGLKEDEGIWLKRCYIGAGLVPTRGHIILTPRFICFWRRAIVGNDIRFRFKCSDVKGAVTAPGMRAAFHGMALQVHGHHDLRLEFWREQSRDEVMTRINNLCKPNLQGRHSTGRDLLTEPPQFQGLEVSPIVSEPEPMSIMDAKMYDRPTDRPSHAADILAPPRDAMFQIRAFPDEALSYMPFIANKPTFTCLTIGSRGDVQPYIALGLRLKRDGHRVVIVTHDEFKHWIEGYGIEHRQAGGDPTALMKLSAEHKMFSPGFFKETLGSFRQWLDDLLVDSWEACKDADVLIESPSAMAGVHIAEALKIPYFRAFTMPWTRTQAYPQAFMVPAFEVGPSFNYSTYVLFDNIIWKATSYQINKWRKQHLGIQSTDMSTLSVSKVPFLYNFSSAVVPKPLDWHDDITITGYWNLENSDTEWSPPAALERFMAKAKEDGKALVYIGFGSIVVPRPNAMTKSIIKAVEKAGVRAIIAKGWSSRGGNPAKEGENIEFPDSCYGLDKVPHNWLFPKVHAALHHGGAGTVGASLRAGIPTLIKPWFGDQFFWANRVTKLGVGLKVPSLRSVDIADALVKATTSQVIIEKAARVGERIRAENGVDNALNAIHYNILRAASDRKKMQWAK